MISVQHLVKRYGSTVAVDDLSFAVDRGEVVGFLGPNGAGKSTTLRVVAGFLGLTSGTVTVAGHDIAKEAFEARQKLGYMPEAVPLYPEMRVAEYLAFRAELKRVPRAERKKAVADAMDKANVRDVENILVGHLSKGYRQRVGIADALVANPPLLVLDEPTAGLDPNQIVEVRDLIQALGKDHTVLLSTHILSEVEASCTRAIVIARGKLVVEGTLADLAKKRRSAGLAVVVRGDRETASRVLGAIEGIAKVKHEGEAEPARGTPPPPPTDGREREVDDVHRLRCVWSKTIDEARAAAAAEEAVAALVAAGLAVREARPAKGTLEELFAELTGGRAVKDEA